MKKYIINDKKVFEIFSKNDSNLQKGLFPIMNKFVQDEINFWVRELKKNILKNDLILEMGCGTGRMLKELKKQGFNVFGFDNNPLFIDHCKKQNLNVFLFDSLDKVPKEHKNKYKVVGIALNTLFNFNKETRKKWIKTASELGTRDCLFIFSAYDDNKFARTTIKERLEYLKSATNMPNYKLEFFDEKNKRGFRLLTPENKLEVYSLWIKKDELIEFKIEKIELMNCGIAYNILLRKK